ncbi:MAG: hypothetical protein EOP48_13870 [Sphingobacteriales bacterium]|nr:MAG: hypothetical protein EOP48_13870 [Sphingobacteriales bacterium]
MINKSKIQVLRTPAEIKFSIKNKQVIGFQTGNRQVPDGIEPVYLRGGYIHPVLSPSGLQVSDDFPLNHKHHHGVWTAWTKTRFEGRSPDFWNMADNTGTIVLEKINEVNDGIVFGSLKSTNAYYDKTVSPNKKVLREDWDIKIFNIENAVKSYYLFDIELKQQCTSPDPLELIKYTYGGLGFRGNWLWNGEGKTYFLTSEGKDRNKGDTTTANWVRISGRIGDKLTGVTVLSHPDNFRSPQPIRIHQKEPFFCFAPPQQGNFTIKPGETYTARYRFIVYDGEPDQNFINQLWNDYADPIKVEIETKFPYK